MNVHFNLAVLTDDPSCNKNFNAPKSETAAVDATPSTSTADEETYVKIPSRNNSASRGTKQPQPTGTFSPTCQRDFSFDNSIPAGCESDDSWGLTSTALEPEQVHNHNIVPLLALRTWTNHPNRGRDQNYTQNNNIRVRNGNVPYSRLWEGQPCRQ